MPRLLPTVLTAAMLAGAQVVAAQQRPMVAGTVRDTAGAPVANADVAIVALRLLVRTGEDGAFRIRNVPPGPHVMTVRRLGFSPATVTVEVPEGGLQDVTVRMEARAAILDAVEVSETDRRRLIGLEDFYRRRARGIGTYITREEIEARRSSRLSDVLRNQPGIRFVRIRGGMGVRFMSAASTRRDCAPQIWVDGTRAENMELDELPIYDVEAVELYHGPATTPLQFSQVTGALMSCGTIVIWTKVPGT